MKGVRMAAWCAVGWCALVADVGGMTAMPGSVAVELEGGCGRSVQVKLVGHAFRKGWVVEGKQDKLCRLADGGFAFVDTKGKCSVESRLSCALDSSPFENGGAFQDTVVARQSLEEEPESYASKQVRNLTLKLKERLRKGDSGSTNRTEEAVGVMTQTEEEPTTMVNLVLMIRFKDHAAKELPSTSQFDIFLNSESANDNYAPTGSLRQYYLEQSYNHLKIQSILSGWIDVDFTEREAAGEFYDEGFPCSGTCTFSQLHDAIKEGLTKFETADPDLFRQVGSGVNNLTASMFSVIHSGYGAESGRGSDASNYWIWSHRHRLSSTFEAPISGIRFSPYYITAAFYGSSGNSMTRLGVVAHEAAHYIGLPDLYDTDDSSYGLGMYDIMANSWGLDQSQYHPGSFSAASKLLLGWISPSIIETGSENSGRSYTIGKIQSTGNAAMMSLNEDISDNTDEFTSSLELIVAEFRDSSGWDTFLPGGVLLWHIDFDRLMGSELQNNNINSNELIATEAETWPYMHYGIRLIQADDYHDLEFKYNQLDDTDWWTSSDQVASDDTLHPGLQTYLKASQLIRSGHELKNFRSVGSSFSLTYNYDLKTTPIPVFVPRPPDSELGVTEYVLIGISAAIATAFVTSKTMDFLLGEVKPPQAQVVVRPPEYQETNSGVKLSVDQKSFPVQTYESARSLKALKSESLDDPIEADRFLDVEQQVVDMNLDGSRDDFSDSEISSSYSHVSEEDQDEIEGDSDRDVDEISIGDIQKE
mmetsp:Transcript_884/g.1754  ORF Transcript_884/g.1754 Transcript_884/m.1754 type:complete len:759 (-) Transcript_884:163-2439(-)